MVSALENWDQRKKWESANHKSDINRKRTRYVFKNELGQLLDTGI